MLWDPPEVGIGAGAIFLQLKTLLTLWVQPSSLSQVCTPLGIP